MAREESELMVKLGRAIATEFLKPDAVARIAEVAPHFLPWFNESGERSFTFNPTPDSLGIGSVEKMIGVFSMKDNAPRHKLPWARAYDYLTLLIELGQFSYGLDRGAASIFLRGTVVGQLALMEEGFLGRAESFTRVLHPFVKEMYSDAILVAHDVLASSGDQRLRKVRSSKGAQPNTWFLSAMLSTAFVSPYIMSELRHNHFAKTLEGLTFREPAIAQKVKDASKRFDALTQEDEELEMRILFQDNNTGTDRIRGKVRAILEGKEA